MLGIFEVTTVYLRRLGGCLYWAAVDGNHSRGREVEHGVLRARGSSAEALIAVSREVGL